MESHGISVLGAMCNEIPCVVSDRGGLKESCVDAITGFVVPITNETFSADKIVFLLANPQKAADMGAEGKRYYTKNFSKALWIQATDKVFQNILSE